MSAASSPASSPAAHPRTIAVTGGSRGLGRAVVLRYAEDLSERQVAEILGISAGSVKTHAFRGLARLRAGGHPDQAGTEEVRR